MVYVQRLNAWYGINVSLRSHYLSHFVKIFIYVTKWHKNTGSSLVTCDPLVQNLYPTCILGEHMYPTFTLKFKGGIHVFLFAV
jgi:hypothetical protein